jgi:AcrR family transcriptional regulator
MPDKKALKKSRMQGYFVTSAKDLINENGVENLSVRTIADRAGYSYATIYNYYSDLDELLWEVKKSFSEDLVVFLTDGEGLQKEARGQENPLIKTFEKYATFFMEHPNLFRFFFQWPLSTESEQAQGTFELYAQIFSASGKTVSHYTEHFDAEMALKSCLYAIHGLLLLYYSENGMTVETFWDDFHAVLTLLLAQKQ